MPTPTIQELRHNSFLVKSCYPEIKESWGAMHGAQVVLSRAAGALPFPMEAKPVDECEKESLESAICSNYQHVLVTG